MTNLISEKHPDKAQALRRAGFFISEKPDGSKWWELTVEVDSEKVIVPDDLDLWGKGEEPHNDLKTETD